MKVFHCQDIEAEDAGKDSSKLTVRWLITKDLGAENFAMRLFEMEAGGYSPFHSHPWEHEVFILEGKGVVVNKTKERKFMVGDVLFIPPHEKHQFKNNNGKTLKFLCLIPYNQK